MNAAECLGHLRGTRVERRLTRLAGDLASRLPMPTGEWGIGLDGRKRLECVLWALGRIDSERSQGALADLLHSSPNPIVRADVMEYMAFGNNFGPELVLPYASLRYSTPEILSALYAMYCRHYDYQPDDVRDRLMPLMEHPHPNVQDYMMDLFCLNEAHRGFLVGLSSHASERIRTLAMQAIRDLDQLSQCAWTLTDS